MSYKIAVASSNGIDVDLHFGSADIFKIYEVDSQSFTWLEDRKTGIITQNKQGSCDCSGDKKSSCGSSADNRGIDVVADCRAVVCQKIGRNILKQLENRAISAFDVNISVLEALEKIVSYFYKIDNNLYRVKYLNNQTNTNYHGQ